MKLFRTLSTTRLIMLVLAVAVLASAATTIAVASGGSSGRTPPPKPLAQALHDALAAPTPAGISARITFTNNLFPSGALTGNVGSALMSAASGRLWATNDGRGRLELQSDAGDVQIVWNQNDVSIFDASSNMVYKAKLPAHSAGQSGSTEQGGIPTVTQISDFLAKLGTHADLSGAKPTNVAHQEAYSVRVSPKHDGGLLGAGELAWDAARGVPLRLGIYAHGSSAPVLELTATKISYGPVSSGDVSISPPASAKTVDLGSLGSDSAHRAATKPEVNGLPAVQKAAGFSLVAPATLVGLPRQDVRLVGGSHSKSVLAVYGQGLGAIVVVERKAGSTGQGGPLGSLPSVAINGATGHELATQLGTAVTWSHAGVAYVLAGSVPAAAAEAAARELK
ncbi:MAG TPA: hypothetical protein VF002_10705 [Gaiellaceae bacterium]